MFAPLAGDYTITCTAHPFERAVQVGNGGFEIPGPVVHGSLRVRVAAGSVLLNAEEAPRQSEFEDEKERRRMEARIRELEERIRAGWVPPPAGGETPGAPD